VRVKIGRAGGSNFNADGQYNKGFKKLDLTVKMDTE